MKIVLVSWQKAFPVITLYDTKTKKLSYTTKLKKDFFEESVRYLLRNAKFVDGFIILFGVDRFSFTRQLTLLGNLFALEYECPISSYTIQNEIVCESDLRDLAERITRKVKWRSVIAPVYSRPPHITKKKR